MSAGATSRKSRTGTRRRMKARRPLPTTLAICANCGARCCRDLVIPIEKPKTPGEMEDLKWELQYDTVCIFIRSHRWYRLIEGRCMYLDRNNRCKIYQRRPRRCRELGPPECERFGRFYEELFTTPQQLEAYLVRRKRR